MYIDQILLAMSQLLCLTFAQQKCYWPNGSSIARDQGDYISCRANEDSNCCLNGEVCISNGLCFGSAYGWIYRGACTVQDWSNTTACPTQWCNDIQYGTWSNIWNCPGINNGPRFYWCGNESEVEACQSADNVSSTQSAFFSSTLGHILGFPPITSIPLSPVAAPATVKSLITVATQFTLVSGAPMTLLSTMAASTTALTPSQHPNQSTEQALAIGAGIGVPLGVAAIGFLVLLFWRQTKRRSMNKHQNFNSGNVDAQGGGGPFANQATFDRVAEFPDSQIPWELDHRKGIVEMPALSSSQS